MQHQSERYMGRGRDQDSSGGAASGAATTTAASAAAPGTAIGAHQQEALRESAGLASADRMDTSATDTIPATHAAAGGLPLAPKVMMGAAPSEVTPATAEPAGVEGGGGVAGGSSSMMGLDGGGIMMSRIEEESPRSKRAGLLGSLRKAWGSSASK
jgi:hypothetical protein